MLTPPSPLRISFFKTSIFFWNLSSRNFLSGLDSSLSATTASTIHAVVKGLSTTKSALRRFDNK